MRILLVLLACAPGVALADTVTSYKDTMGYTHYRGSNFTGRSNVDTFGYRHSTWRDNGGKTTRCIEHKTTMGQTITRCN